MSCLRDFYVVFREKTNQSSDSMDNEHHASQRKMDFSPIHGCFKKWQTTVLSHVRVEAISVVQFVKYIKTFITHYMFEVNPSVIFYHKKKTNVTIIDNSVILHYSSSLSVPNSIIPTLYGHFQPSEIIQFYHRIKNIKLFITLLWIFADTLVLLYLINMYTRITNTLYTHKHDSPKFMLWGLYLINI